MAVDPAAQQPPPPPSGPPQSPPEGASRSEWRAWRHEMRAYERSRYGGGPWGGNWWGWFWPVALVVVGAYSLLNNLGLLTWLRGDVLWPSLLILLGLVLLFRRSRP